MSRAVGILAALASVLGSTGAALLITAATATLLGDGNGPTEPARYQVMAVVLAAVFNGAGALGIRRVVNAIRTGATGAGAR